MNIITLKEYSDGRAVYFYQPEGRGEPGEVFFDLASEMGEITVLSVEDSVIGSYGNKAIRKIRERRRENKYSIPMEIVQAWC